MRLSLHEVLAIVGRLDDAPGFDTPRARFRRFLVDHMTSVAIARTFLDEAQQLISEQYQRALQDTILGVGQLLGFEITFGGYERHGAVARTAGQWLSRRRLAVTVQVWSDSAATDSLAVARMLEMPLLEAESAPAQSRLCVVTPSFSSRHRLEESLGSRPVPTRIVSVRSLIDLVGVSNTTLIGHEDVLRLLYPAAAMEPTIALLTRLVHPVKTTSPVASEPVTPPVSPSHACWVHVVREREDGDHRSAVSDVLHLMLPSGEGPSIRTGDAVAFLVPSKGVVAHAEIASIAEVLGAADDTHTKFAVNLREVVIFEPALNIDTEQRLNLELQAAVSHEPYVRVGRHEFEELTTARTAEKSFDRAVNLNTN